MGRYIFRLPDIGEGIAEAEIVAWYVKPGDRVREDQSVVDILTDKATVDMTSPVEGVITAVHGEIGGMAAVGSVLVEFEVKDEADLLTADSSPGAAAPTAKAAPAAVAPNSEPPSAPSKAAPPPARIGIDAPATRVSSASPLASPATRRRAYELGIPLQFVPGTGPGGRVRAEDLDAYIASGPASSGFASHPRREAVTEIRIMGLRRKIAERMQESKRRIPHFGYVEEFDLTPLEALRFALNADRSEGQPKLTILPFFMRALVRTLPEFPYINARYDDDAGILQTFEGVHIGIATQTPNGLMVPVVRHAEARDLWDCAAELGTVTAAAREGRALRDELTGSTITLTSLGPLGGIAATPVINHPEVAIIGPNKLVERPMIQDGQVVMRKMMNVSSSFDHRIVDGYDAARFIQRLKRLIEQPALLFMD